MKELEEQHIKFLSNKILPMLKGLDGNTITFDEMKYTHDEIIEWVHQILDRGEYTTNEKRFLTGMSKLYEHLNK